MKTGMLAQLCYPLRKYFSVVQIPVLYAKCPMAVEDFYVTPLWTKSPKEQVSVVLISFLICNNVAFYCYFFLSILYRFLRPALHLLITSLIGVDDTHRDHFMLKRVMTCERAWSRKRKLITTVVRPVISNLGIRIFQASVNPDWCVLLCLAFLFSQREFICFLIVFTRSCLCSHFHNLYRLDQ